MPELNGTFLLLRITQVLALGHGEIRLGLNFLLTRGLCSMLQGKCSPRLWTICLHYQHTEQNKVIDTIVVQLLRMQPIAFWLRPTLQTGTHVCSSKQELVAGEVMGPSEDTTAVVWLKEYDVFIKLPFRRNFCLCSLTTVAANFRHGERKFFLTVGNDYCTELQPVKLLRIIDCFCGILT